jgi:membrane protease YdiL (CAAX protease family)
MSRFMNDNPNNTARGYASTVAVIVCALALYVSTALVATALSGSPMIGAVASNAALFIAGLFWLSSRWHQDTREITVVPVAQLAGIPRFWALVGLGLVFCWLVGQAASVWLYSYVGSPNFDQHAQTTSEAPALLMLLVVLVLAPMGEEVLMRGVAYSQLRKHVPPLAAAVLTTGVFSLMHLNLVQIVVTVPLGLLLAAVYERTGRLAPIIVMHVIFNVFSVIVPPALVAGFASLPFVLLGGAAIALLLAAIYRGLGTSVQVQIAASRTRSG